VRALWHAPNPDRIISRDTMDHASLAAIREAALDYFERSGSIRLAAR
jgi:hypothetical protein